MRGAETSTAWQRAKVFIAGPGAAQSSTVIGREWVGREGSRGKIMIWNWNWIMFPAPESSGMLESDGDGLEAIQSR